MADRLAPSSFLSPVLGGLTPHLPGEQPRGTGLIKLNTNENPYPPSPRVVAAVQAAASSGLEFYPDPTALALREVVAAYHGLQSDQVFAGNGSDEVLAHAFFAFFQHGAPLVMPDVTYGFYAATCRLYGIAVEAVPLDAQLRVDVAAMAERAGAPCSGVVLANPNAPTGLALPLDAVEVLLRACPQRVVLVDEAYVDFGGESAAGLIDRHLNLLVVHTLSKSRSLAGLRVGVAMGQRPLIAALERVKDSFNCYPLGRLALAGAVASYEDDAWFKQNLKAVVHSREGLALQLEDLGFAVLPSQTNFLFVRHPSHDAEQLARALREQGVVVRHFAQPARIAQHLRISVGSPAQCDALVEALRTVLASGARDQ